MRVTLIVKPLGWVSASLIALCFSMTMAQVRSVPTAKPSQAGGYPGHVTSDWERVSIPRLVISPPDRQSIILQTKSDFRQLQLINYEQLQSINSQPALDYKYISDRASKIKKLAHRLNSNLAFGKLESEGSTAVPECSDEHLKASLISLNRHVYNFVHNPIFREKGVFNIPETKRAREDVDRIIVTSEQTKAIAQKLKKQRGS
jgi:hypothetical protein